MPGIEQRHNSASGRYGRMFPASNLYTRFNEKSCKMPEGRSPRLDLHGLQLQYQQLRQRPNQGALLRPCRPQHLYLLPLCPST